MAPAVHPRGLSRSLSWLWLAYFLCACPGARASPGSDERWDAAVTAEVDGILEAFGRSRRVGRREPDFSYARDLRDSSDGPRGGPRPGRNMPHFDFRTLLESYWTFGQGFDLREFLDRTLHNLWLASRKYGDRIEWDRVTFSFGEILGGAAQAHGGGKGQTVLWQTPHGDGHPAPPDLYDLIHELAHVYQYQKGYRTPVGILFGEQLPSILGRDPNDYGGRMGLAEKLSDPRLASFSRLDAEQGAEILAHYALLQDSQGSRARRFYLAEKMDKSVRCFKDADELFGLLERYAAQVLPEAAPQELVREGSGF